MSSCFDRELSTWCTPLAVSLPFLSGDKHKEYARPRSCRGLSVIAQQSKARELACDWNIVWRALRGGLALVAALVPLAVVQMPDAKEG